MKIRRILRWVAVVTAVIITAVYFYTQPRTGPESYILTGGEIITLDETAPKVEAVWVKDGVVKSTGSFGEVKAEAGPTASVVDLQGQTLIPGFIEPHTHPLAAALLSQTIDVSGRHFSSRQKIMEHLKEQADTFQPSPWVVAFGWDTMLVPELTPPTLAELDALFPEKPFIILTQAMHELYANSAALKAAGITKDTPNPEHGEFVRDEYGELTGTVLEVGAIRQINVAMPPVDQTVARLLVRLQYGRYASAGYTSIGAMGLVGRVDGGEKILEEMASDPAVGLRTRVWLTAEVGSVKSETSSDKPYALSGVKFWLDGSPFVGGAAFREPYADTPVTRDIMGLAKGHQQLPVMSEKGFNSAFLAYHKSGTQVAVHTQGEAAIDIVLAAVEQAQKLYPRSDLRHRLEHNALITHEQLRRAADLDLEVSFFPDHIYYYGHQLENIVGPERTRRYMPVKSAYDVGLKPSLHADHPMTDPDPMRVFRIAVLHATRQDGAVIAPDQRISRLDALKAMTINAARHIGTDHISGTISVGKSADFTLLSGNLLEVPDGDLEKVKVTTVWAMGKQVDSRSFLWANIVDGARAFSHTLFSN